MLKTQFKNEVIYVDPSVEVHKLSQFGGPVAKGEGMTILDLRGCNLKDILIIDKHLSFWQKLKRIWKNER